MSSVYQPLTKRRKTDQLPNLSEDEIVSILQWLPIKKLIQLECVSLRWKYMLIPRSFDTAKRKCLKLKDFLLRPYCIRCNPRDNTVEFKILTKLLDLMGPHLTSVNLNCSQTRVSPKELQLLTTKCPNASHLTITRYPVSGECLSVLPPTITSVKVRIDAASLDQDGLEEFLQTHSGLKQFWLKTTNPIRDVPSWLAQYCTGLTHLTLFALDGWKTLPIEFVNVFPSLTHLKELEVNYFSSFNSEDLASLCANCPELEVLNWMHMPRTILTVADAILIGHLKKLRRIQLWHTLTDQCVMALCQGVGAKLEYFDLQTYSLTDISVRAISRYCHKLTFLRLNASFPRNDSFSSQAMAHLIRGFVTNPFWNDPIVERHLRIETSNLTRYSWINLDQYGGRVELVEIS